MASAWAPGHTTLFFAVPDQFDDPSMMGSLGGGLNLDTGVTTTIIKNDKTEVYWNEEIIDGLVTKTVVDLFQDYISSPINVKINHSSNLKTGYGLSTSGAGAIGTALVLNKLLNRNLSKTELFDIAHRAEIINHTGLGSVVGQITGGLELRLSQGGPKNCNTISVQTNAEIILALIGPLSTKEVLTSPSQMELVTKSGIESVNKVQHMKNVTIEEFIQIGRNFTETCGLQTQKVKEAIENLDSIGETISTMAMIGETIIIKPINKQAVIRLLNHHGIEYLETSVTNKLPYVFYKNI